MKFENWIDNIINKECPDEKIVAYYFGIFESGEKEYTLYLSGSTEFNEENSDWACNDDFEPKEKYLSLPQYHHFEWEDVLNEIVKILQEFIHTDVYKNSFLSQAKAIATGFDEGDLILITFVKRSVQ
ncbi:hypothetical protein AGMMS50262_23200 [Bacteroidia bacterium]|nr:hypothetical protein AGMMS50262_23200 [Bacteroidia bacterium]